MELQFTRKQLIDNDYFGIPHEYVIQMFGQDGDDDEIITIGTNLLDDEVRHEYRLKRSRRIKRKRNIRRMIKESRRRNRR